MTPDLDTIRSELESFYNRPTVQPGDITIQQLIEISGRSENSLRTDLRMKRNLPPGYTAHKVYSPEARTEVWVLRKT